MDIRKNLNLLVIGLLVVIIASLSYLSYERWGRQSPLPEGLIQANGRIEGDRVTVAGKFSGRIHKIFAREGDTVTKGQVLVQMDDAQVRARASEAQKAVAVQAARIQAAREELSVFRKEVPLVIESAEAGIAKAHALVATAEAAEEQARRDSERFRELADRGSVDRQRSELADLAWTRSRNELASARNTLSQAQKQLSQAQLGWDRIRVKEREISALEEQRLQAQAARAEAESVLTDLTITAPASGIIMTKVVEEGEMVSPGSPLYEIVDLGSLYLKVYVPEFQIGRLRLGLQARIYTDAFPEAPFDSVVRYISSRAEFTPREVQTPDERVKLVYAVKLYLLKNPDNRMTPGLPADAVIRWKENTPWVRPR